MQASTSQAAPNAAAEVSQSPAENATPAPDPELKRWYSLQGGTKAKQFAARLKSDAQWVMQFLHGGK